MRNKVCLIVIFLLGGCDFWLGQKPKGITLYNDSNQKIYYLLSKHENFFESENPFEFEYMEGEDEKGRKFKKKFNKHVIEPLDSKIIKGYYLKNQNVNIYLFIFNEDLKNKKKWAEILNDQIYSRKYKINYLKAEKSNWKINYTN